MISFTKVTIGIYLEFNNQNIILSNSHSITFVTYPYRTKLLARNINVYNNSRNKKTRSVTYPAV